MFAKFNYSPSGAFYNSVINHYYTIGVDLFTSHEKEVQGCLAKYITEDGIINGTELKERWFSITPKDIFISHSHNDLNRVKAFAGWLHTTSHVHMMLSTALTEMMDNTECVIFFNTPNSINMADELEKIEKKNKKETTISPWIYHELSMTTMLRSKCPQRKKKVIEHFAQDSRDKLTIQYDVKKAMGEMITLTDTALSKWNENWNKRPIKVSEEALDELYRIVFPKG